MTPPEVSLRRPDLAERAAFRRWLRREIRPIIGWLLLVLGGVSLFLAWYGVSGQSLTAKQLPYLVSGGLTGIALVVIAAAFIVTDDFRRQVGRLHDLEHKVDDLYSLLVETPGEAAVTDAAQRVAAPAGSTYHRSSCRLTAGKTGVVVVTDTDIRRRGLGPCPICSPDP